MNDKPKLIPKLRFPQFQNDGEWEIAKADTLFDLQEGYPFSSSYLVKEKKDSKQIIRITEINNKNKNTDKVYISNKKIESLNIKKYEVRKGDLLLSLTGASGFNFFIWDSDEIAYINQRTMKISPKSSENEALKILLEPLIHKIINKKGTGQNNNLSKETLKNIKLIYPKSAEQQEIAACLSSLDALIAAEIKKLELLKKQKKGLLQQLFPQEGEKIPKLRFPEFQNEGEWEEKKIGEVFKSYSGGTPSTTQKLYYGGNIPFIRSAEINNTSTKLFLTELGLKNSSAKMVSKGDLLVALYGANSGEVAISKIDGAINQAVLCLKSEFSNTFVYHFLSSRKHSIISKYLQGGQGNLSGEIIKSISLLFPSKSEQEEIAACLSCADRLIELQGKKIELLQKEKKGLLQHLFPQFDPNNV